MRRKKFDTRKRYNLYKFHSFSLTVVEITIINMQVNTTVWVDERKQARVVFGALGELMSSTVWECEKSVFNAP